MWTVPRVNVFDAGKMQTIASKTFSERQPANSETRASSRVGCLLLGRWWPSVQSAWSLFANGQRRSRVDLVGDPPADQQRPGAGTEAGLHVRAVRRKRIPTEFGKQLLHAVRRDELQDFLDRSALVLGSSVVKHLRWFLNAIFKLAVSDGLVLSNPAAELRIPKKCRPGRAMRPLTEEEVMDYLEVFDLRERLIARLNDAIRVEQRVYKRIFDTPKNGKTREVAISDGTSELLKEWHDLAEDPSPEGFVFPSETLVTSLSADNLWRRTMKPRLAKVGLGWATFQVLRKTNASLSKKAGVDPKVASDQRGHGIGVSLEVYTSSDLEQKREAVNKLEAVLLRKPQPLKRSA